MVRNPRRGMANWLGMAQRAGVVQAQTLQAQEELARARDAQEQLARTQEAQELPTSAVQAGCRTRSRAEAPEHGRPIGPRSFTWMARGHIPGFGSRRSHHLGWLLWQPDGRHEVGDHQGFLGSRWPHDPGQADLAQARAAWSVRAQVLLAQGAAGACSGSTGLAGQGAASTRAQLAQGAAGAERSWLSEQLAQGAAGAGLSLCRLQLAYGAARRDPGGLGQKAPVLLASGGKAKRASGGEPVASST